MEKVIVNLVKLQNQLRVLHWQTDSYAQHQAFGKAYEGLDGLIDSLVEVHQGKYGKIMFSAPFSIDLVNINEISINEVLTEVTDYLSAEFSGMVDTSKDTDCLNVRDSILQELNQLKYLLTLK
jgi:hypothetical protein